MMPTKRMAARSLTPNPSPKERGVVTSSADNVCGPSASMSIYSPPHRGRGWGWGFSCMVIMHKGNTADRTMPDSSTARFSVCVVSRASSNI